MIIDAHTHIGKLLPNSRFSESYEKNLDFILKEMEQNSVDHAVIIAGFSKKDGHNISTKSLLALTKNIQNISVIGSIDVLNYQKDDLAQLDEWAKDRSIVGIKLYTGYQHFYPNDERCKHIYELCLTYDITVIFHSGDTLAGSVENPKVKYAHPLHIDEIAADLPQLKIVIAHMGNPWLIDCAEVLYKNPNVYADISGLVVGDELDTPYGELMKKRIEELITYIEPTHKLLYGTDWPLCPMNSYIRFANSLNLSEEFRERLFYKNAVEVFKLKV